MKKTFKPLTLKFLRFLKEEKIYTKFFYFSKPCILYPMKKLSITDNELILFLDEYIESVNPIDYIPWIMTDDGSEFWGKIASKYRIIMKESLNH